MRSIRVFAKNMGDPYYEPTIVVHDYMNKKLGNFKMRIGIAEKSTKQEGIAGVVM